jgi:hypothetical protein
MPSGYDPYEERTAGERSWYGTGGPARSSGFGVPGGSGQASAGESIPPAQTNGGWATEHDPNAPGAYGQAGPPSGWGGYGQSAPTSAGWGAYGQPGPPSWGGYGQSAPPSWGGSGYGQYGQWAPPSGWGSQTAPGWQPGAPAADDYGYGWVPRPSRPLQGGWIDGSWQAANIPTAGYGWDQQMAVPRRSSRARLWVTLGVIAALLVVAVAGAGYVVFQVFTPTATVDSFCGDLRSSNYSDAYSMLGGTLQQQLSLTQFAQAQVALARVQGGVVRCGVDSAGTSYQYHPGDSAAALGLYIEWAKAGRLIGTAQMRNDSGWKFETLDSHLFGANLGAMSAAATYCQALLDQDYSTEYAVMSSTQQQRVKAADYAQLGQWQDQIDGAVTACTIAQLASGNTDTTVSLTVSMTRAKLGQRKDALVLGVEAGAWKITSIGGQLQGTDVGGLAVGIRFCADIAKGDYADAYSLTTEPATFSEDAFARSYNGQDSGIKLTNCTSDVSTYKVSGTSATLDTHWSIERLSDGATGQGTVTETMTKIGDGWKLTNLGPKQ